jgi:hypothetical protein
MLIWLPGNLLSDGQRDGLVVEQPIGSFQERPTPRWQVDMFEHGSDPEHHIGEYSSQTQPADRQVKLRVRELEKVLNNRLVARTCCSYHLSKRGVMGVTVPEFNKSNSLCWTGFLSAQNHNDS